MAGDVHDVVDPAQQPEVAVGIEACAVTCEVRVPHPVHTNHALDRAVAEVAEAPSERSLSRFRRAAALLERDAPATAQDAMRILADHGAARQDICVQPDPAEGDEASAIQFGMVCDVGAGVMWLAPGQPCTTPFRELRLDELLAGCRRHPRRQPRTFQTTSAPLAGASAYARGDARRGVA